MQVKQKEILDFIGKKIQTDEMWAEAFGKLITLDEPDQNGAVWDMLESINDSIRWDELFAQHPEVLDKLEEGARKSIEAGQTISLEEFFAIADSRPARRRGYKTVGARPIDSDFAAKLRIPRSVQDT